MIDTPQTYDWLDPAQDCLKEVGLDDAADALARLPTVEERLKRAIETIEDYIANGPIPRSGWIMADPMVNVVAQHRGETPEATLVRLRPAPPRIAPNTPITRVGYNYRPWQAGDPPATIWAYPRYRGPSDAPIDSTFPMDTPRPTSAIGGEREQLNEFIRESGVVADDHGHVVYSAPDYYPDRIDDKIHVLIPLSDVPASGQPWPTRDEACRRYPWRRIWQESVFGGDDR